ncbi:hypothetical protein K4K48_008793 [Colletotrichum sp. SAR 10_66]|nr:hypothetical protein K4K48_008793 [Colletotrichum sp. SAR 10_66]
MSLEPKDFPQMWQKPSSEDLLTTLKQLELSPPIWSHKRKRSEIVHEQEATAYFRREVSMYLSSIIKSGLAWIEDDDEKEAIWTEASKRMTERCGRTAMGEITRRWPFREDARTPTFELIIREPPLTGDSLGLKTWGSSYVLAQYLPSLGPTSLFRLFDESLGQPRPPVLELGSGTGLLGLAAAALWKVHVILSDLPDIMENLRFNVEANRATVEKLGGSLDAGALTWGGSGEDEVDQDLFEKKNQFKVVLAADPLYDDIHPGLLAGAFSDQLSLEEDARQITYTEEQILFILRLSLENEKRDEILRQYHQRFNKPLTASQLRYVKGKYGHDPEFGHQPPPQPDPAWAPIWDPDHPYGYQPVLEHYKAQYNPNGSSKPATKRKREDSDDVREQMNGESLQEEIAVDAKRVKMESPVMNLQYAYPDYDTAVAHNSSWYQTQVSETTQMNENIAQAVSPLTGLLNQIDTEFLARGKSSLAISTAPSFSTLPMYHPYTGAVTAAPISASYLQTPQMGYFDPYPDATWYPSMDTNGTLLASSPNSLPSPSNQNFGIPSNETTSSWTTPYLDNMNEDGWHNTSSPLENSLLNTPMFDPALNQDLTPYMDPALLDDDQSGAETGQTQCYDHAVKQEEDMMRSDEDGTFDWEDMFDFGSSTNDESGQS